MNSFLKHSQLLLMLFFFSPCLKTFSFLRITRRQELLLISPPALGRLPLEMMGHKPTPYPLLPAALPGCTHTHIPASHGGCFAPEGTAWCSPSAGGAFGCRASSFPHPVVRTRLPGSWIPGLNQGSALPAAAHAASLSWG